MLSFLRRPSAALDVAVVGGPARPGDTIDVHITILPRQSICIRDGSIELVCTETYWAESSRGEAVTYRVAADAQSPYRDDSKAMYGRQHRRTKTVRFTRPLVHLRESFQADTEVSDGVQYRKEVSFSIPGDAPPSITGSAANICWRLKAWLDVPKVKDIQREQEVIVLSLPLSEGADEPKLPSAPVLSESIFEQCTLSLSLSSAHVRTGETLEGVLRANIWQTLSLEEIWVELERVEQSGVRRAERVAAREDFAGPNSLMAGQLLEWPFQLRVPEADLPSMAAGETSVVWRVKGIGVVSKFRRLDFQVEQLIQVYSR